MSNIATKWAWQADLQPHLKYVLLALADCHNHRTGQCNPRVDTLAHKLGKSKRATQYALDQLEEYGFIAKARRRKGSRQTSNHYALALDGVVFQNTTGCTLKKRKNDAGLHSENTLGCTLYKEPESEQGRTLSENVIEIDIVRRA